MKRQLSLLATLALTDVLKRLHKALLLARNCLEHEDLGEKETWVSIKARFGRGYQIVWCYADTTLLCYSAAAQCAHRYYTVLLPARGQFCCTLRLKRLASFQLLSSVKMILFYSQSDLSA